MQIVCGQAPFERVHPPCLRGTTGKPIAQTSESMAALRWGEFSVLLCGASLRGTQGDRPVFFETEPTAPPLAHLLAGFF